MQRNLDGQAKAGLYRDGKRVYVIFEFESEYDAMQAFDFGRWMKLTFISRDQKPALKEIKKHRKPSLIFIRWF